MTAIISYSIRDADGDVQAMPIYVNDTGLDLADITGYANQFGDLLNAAIDGAIDKVSVTISVAPDVAWRTVPVAFSETQKGGILQFSLTGTSYKHSIRVPTLSPNLFTGDTIDDTDPLVAAVIDAMVAGLTPVITLVQPVNKFNIDVNGFVSGKKSFHK